MENPTEIRTTPGGAASQTTIAALFEDAVDAEHALIALRKADHSADRVSLLVRHRQDAASAADGAVDVARDLVAAALGAVAHWLTGLAELIVSERERYLVAGPMGAAFTGAGRGQARPVSRDAGDAGAVAAELTADSLQWVLIEFGFSRKEASYMEHRLTAGATLIATTTSDDAEGERARHVFGDHGAVYIEDAVTRSDVLETAGALLAAPLAGIEHGEAGVADAVANIRPVAGEDRRPDLEGVHGRPVIDADGDDAGQVEWMLVEDLGQRPGAAGETAAGAVELRYVVIEFGGVLGIGRHHVAIPAQLVDLAAEPVRVRLDKAALSRAPAYDEDVPLGRREEERIFRFYDIAPYWTAPKRSAPAPVSSIGEQDDRAIERR